jgi:hypothetical protein
MIPNFKSYMVVVKKRSGIQTFFSTTVQPFMPHFRFWVFLNRVLCTRLHPHRLRHCRAFVFSRLWRQNPSHSLCVWSVSRNIIMECGIKKPGSRTPAFFTLEKRLRLIKYSYGWVDRARPK